MATIMISAVWDPTIEKYAGRVPVAFIRALIHGESGGNSQLENPASHAAGLLQLTEIVRRDWNEAHPDAPVSREQLFDPEASTFGSARGAAGTASSRSTRDNPTAAPAGMERVRRYAELVALGWNAGYSDRGGVGLAVTHLEAAGAAPADVTVDSVARVAAGLPQVASRASFSSAFDRIAYARRRRRPLPRQPDRTRGRFARERRRSDRRGGPRGPRARAHFGRKVST